MRIRCINQFEEGAPVILEILVFCFPKVTALSSGQPIVLKCLSHTHDLLLDFVFFSFKIYIQCRMYKQQVDKNCRKIKCVASKDRGSARI